MSKKILSSPLIYPILLVLICLFIAFKNYTPGTFLTGWDTLHPEFNFPVNFQRLVFGVWRADQGLGAVSGHSAMADLPRVFILWLFHFIFPLSFLRYSYIFLCLILGPLGFYFLIKFLFKKFSHVSLLSFIGALTYLLSLGTVQQFYVPFEMFPTQWAYLPWIILYSLKYLYGTVSNRSLLIFSILTLLSTPQAYAAHLWYPFFGLYCLFLILHFTVYRSRFTVHAKLISLILLINSFWLLPNIYFAATSAQNPQNDKSNRLYSQEYLLRNRQTGTLGDVFLLKGFYLNWESFNFSRQANQPLMPVWQKHLQNFDVVLIGSLIFVLAFTGLIASFIKKDPIFISLSPFFIVSFGLLANNTPFFSQIFDLLLKIPLIEEIFRFIFTKLSIILTFSVALYFTYFLHFFFITTHRHFIKLFCFLTIIALIVYAYPIFQGQLIGDLVKVKIPDSYFQTWDYLSQQPAGKVLTLPLQAPSGWQYYDWGYQGSGLIWFGSPQGFLDRDSDRWEMKNEEAYREFYYPLYANNYPSFLSSLKKYHLGYIVWDTSNTFPSSKNQNQATFKNEIGYLLNDLIDQGNIELANQFDNIQIYKIVTDDETQVRIQTINQSIGPSYSLGYYDSQFQNQDYLTTATNSFNFPFRSLISPTNRLDPQQFQIYADGDNWKLKIANLDPLDIGITQVVFSKVTSNPNVTIDRQGVSVKSSNNIQGFSYNINDIPHSQSFIFGIESKYLHGIPLRICLKNSYSNLCVFEDQLSKNQQLGWDYFLIPPMDNFDSYELQINAISYGNFLTSSQVTQLRIIPISYDLLSSLPQLPPPPEPNQISPSSYHPIFPNNSLISLKASSVLPNSYLTLYQSFSPGWLAFYFQNNQIKFLTNHVLINNWANGWQLPVSSFQNPVSIYILFWPQLLEFLGFGFLFFAFFLMFLDFKFKIRN